MSVTTNLSVAEMNHQSDRVGMRQGSWTHVDGVTREHYLQIEVTNRQKLVIKSTSEYKTRQTGRRASNLITEYKEIEFDKCDIDSLILFLQDAKQFIQEDLVYRKLRGEK